MVDRGIGGADLKVIPARLFQRPTAFAAIVVASATIGVAVAGAIGGGVSSYFQHQTDVARLKAEILLNLVKGNDGQRKEYTMRLIQSGVLQDEDGAICMAFVGEDCPIKIKRPN